MKKKIITMLLTALTFTVLLSAMTFALSDDDRINAMTLDDNVVATIDDTGVDYPWTYDSGTTIKSTNQQQDSSTSTISIKFSSPSDFMLSFDYSVSSEASYDELTVAVDNSEIAVISGVTNCHYICKCSAGEHTLTLAYEKDWGDFGDIGEDTAYISNIKATTDCPDPEDVMELNGVTAEFVDYNTYSVGTETNWCTSYPWVKDTSIGGLKSSNQHMDSSTSPIVIKFSSQSDFMLSFDYPVSSESGADYLTVAVDNSEIAVISGGESHHYIGKCSAGEHTLTLAYEKDWSDDSGDDTAYISKIEATTDCPDPEDVMELNGVTAEFVDHNMYSVGTETNWCTPYPWVKDTSTGGLKSSNQHMGYSTSPIVIKFSSQSDFMLSFDYPVSSEYDYDKLTVAVDNSPIAVISGVKNCHYIGKCSAGEHTLTLAYQKDGSEYEGDDTAYISNIKAIVTSFPVAAQVEGEHGTASTNFSEAEAGQSVVFTAEPDTGYEFDHWEVVKGGVSLAGNTANPITVTMPEEDLTLRAYFRPIKYAILVENDGNGTATAQVGGADAATAVMDAAVTLTAVPNDGYIFKEWQIVSGLEAGAITDSSFTMPANDVQVKAIFEEVQDESDFEEEYPYGAVYSVNVSENVNVSVGRSTYGKVVTFNVAPGFVPNVFTAKGAPIPVNKAADGSYWFAMPGSGVTITTTCLFGDVQSGEYFYDAVLWAAANGITTGTDETHFAPYAPVTRAQAVTFLWRAAGCPEPSGNADKFSDVENGSYYEKAVAWAIGQGITKGTSPTEFSPDMVCTRAHIVTFLARFARVKDADTASAFSDVEPTDYYAAAVKWAKDNKVTEGTSETLFSPNLNCTRGQVVTFLWRWMGK